MFKQYKKLTKKNNEDQTSDPTLLAWTDPCITLAAITSRDL